MTVQAHEAVWQSADGQFALRGGALGRADIGLAEVKGPGHPDSLADDLAEALSSAYALHTLARAGAVLHHNFDKVCLLGGASTVSLGSGVVTSPVRVLVNGRASLRFAGRDLGVPALLRSVVRDFFTHRLPGLDAGALEVELNLSTASSPGHVDDPRALDTRRHWFEPRSLDDLRERRTLLANDTSLGTGFAPLDPASVFAITAIGALRSRSWEWLGGDIKAMVLHRGDRLTAVLCLPQLAHAVPDLATYQANLESAAELLHASAQSMGLSLELSLNTRDRPDALELYLTATGSSLESGDEGVVGRGNRVNGVITPMLPMNMEGFAGKNPVYHVGKLYNVVAVLVAVELHERFGGRFVVHLVSAAGRPLLEPHRVVIDADRTDLPPAGVLEIVRRGLNAIPKITDRIVRSSAREVVGDALVAAGLLPAVP